MNDSFKLELSRSINLAQQIVGDMEETRMASDRGTIKAAYITAGASILVALIALAGVFVNGRFQRQAGFDEGISQQTANIEQQLEDAHSKGYAQGLDDGKNASDSLSSNTGSSTEENADVPDGNEPALSTSPVYIGEGITAYQRWGNNYEEYSIDDNKSFTINGVRYRRGILATNRGGGPGGASYNLNGNYKELVGIIGFVDGTKMEDGYVLFIGDGEPILDYKLSATALGADFSLDVSGVHHLKIQFDFGWSIGYAIANARLIA